MVATALSSTAQRTPDVQRQEWLTCRYSPLYFVDTYCRVYDALSGAWVPFRLWPAQARALKVIRDNRLVCILKARQLGVTWLALSYALWLMLFHPAATVLLFSRRDDEAIDLLDFRLKGMYALLPPWMKARAVEVDSAHEWALSNGSRAIAFPTTAGDSYTATLVIGDEFDLVENQDRLLGAVKPTIDNGGRMLLLSRPDKARPHTAFKNIYRAAKQGLNDWACVFLPWTAHPNRDAAWYEAQRAEIGSRTGGEQGTLDVLHEQYPATDAEALAQAYAFLVYDNFDLTGNVTPDADYDPALGPVYWACDDGYAFGDGPGHENYHPRVILAAQFTPQGGVRIFNEYIRAGVPDFKTSIAAALEWSYPKPQRAFTGPGMAMFGGALHAASIGTLAVNEGVAETIKNMRRLICDGNGVRLLTIHPRCAHTVSELAGYHYDKGAHAKFGEMIPAKIDDHAPDALRYLTAGLRARRAE